MLFFLSPQKQLGLLLIISFLFSSAFVQAQEVEEDEFRAPMFTTGISVGYVFEDFEVWDIVAERYGMDSVERTGGVSFELSQWWQASGSDEALLDIGGGVTYIPLGRPVESSESKPAMSLLIAGVGAKITTPFSNFLYLNMGIKIGQAFVLYNREFQQGFNPAFEGKLALYHPVSDYFEVGLRYNWNLYSLRGTGIRNELLHQRFPALGVQLKY